LQAADPVSNEQKAAAIRGLFQDNPTAGGTFVKTLLLFAVIPLLALLIVYHFQQRAQGDRARRPVRLLWDLGRTASLGWWDRLLLIRMTRQVRMAHPAAVLLSANSYDRVTAAWLRAGGGEGRARLQRIRRKLFGR
jgi:hypothetical protein